MNGLRKRIEYVEKAIKTLTAWEPKNHQDKLNKIINLAEYKEELKQLRTIARANASLMR